MSGREVRRFVADLLGGRRPRRFRAEEADAAELRAAILLRAARQGSGAPREEFVTGLARRLAAELDGPAPGTSGAPHTGGSRRRFVQGASIAAAATIGAVMDHTLTGTATTPTGPDNNHADATLTPVTGTWQTVAATGDVPDGGVRAFDVGSVVGFVHRSNGAVRAVSGICTHQGCRLLLNGAARRLDCPCHNAAFAVTGELLTHQFPAAPRPLPQLDVREVNGTIDVFAPPTPA